MLVGRKKREGGESEGVSESGQPNLRIAAACQLPGPRPARKQQGHGKRSTCLSLPLSSVKKI